ncbi:Rrf2 family transcriptional regulator [Micromonospora sp. WMMD882]|uniref:RrF2 family transcriptional regulator n=1 Tax=Micromonospora sp. WMMD882 TaxID=3015151 RepID=UPI00248B058A|nr:Rrf2 family transcriptional regulator [Micromonospora sp. WMMD882]WBB81644.1 Rrf2 family transcriptional regulator [Micromonospora sp. WMMD882]
MKLNRSTDTALRIAMLTSASTARTTVDELAERLVLPRNQVAKTVQRLQRLGVLVTIRGRSGGVLFAESAAALTVGAIVRAFEGDDEVVDCHRPACPLLGACALRGELRRAQRAFLDVLDQVRLGDLAAGAAGSVLLGLGHQRPTGPAPGAVARRPRRRPAPPRATGPEVGTVRTR